MRLAFLDDKKEEFRFVLGGFYSIVDCHGYLDYILYWSNYLDIDSLSSK